MSDERRNDSSGAVVAIVVVVALVGLVVMAGVSGLLFFRFTAVRNEEEARFQAVQANMDELSAAIHAHDQAVEAHKKSADILPALEEVTGELLLEIDAAGEFTLSGKKLKADELKAALVEAAGEKPATMRLKIKAHPKTPFEKIEAAMTAGTAAGIVQQAVERPAAITEPASIQP